MSIKRTLAGAVVAALGLSGIVMGAGAANAAEEVTLYTAVGEITKTANPAEETQFYNQWHFDPSRNQVVDSAPNGVVIPGGNATVILKGNGLDGSTAAEANPGLIEDLALSLRVSSSKPEAVSYQVPVFYGYSDGHSPKFTTLRKSASDVSNDGDWTTSSVIPGHDKNTSAPLDELIAALGADARPIGAGVWVDDSDPVLVSSFKALNETTKFYAKPTATPASETTSEFVKSEQIRPDENEYPGWHQGYPSGVGPMASVENGDDVVIGLQIEGRSQILNGFDANTTLANGLLLADSTIVDVAEQEGPVQAQFPVFYWRDGDNNHTFTTVYATVPEGGNLADATGWASSNDLVQADGTILVEHTKVSLEKMLEILGVHTVIGYGVQIDPGTVATIRSISFNGKTTNFADLEALEAAEKLAAAEQKVKDAIATLVDDKGAVLADVTQKKVDDAQAALGELKALDEGNGLVVEATTAIKTAQDKLDADAAAEKLAAAEAKVADAIKTLVDDEGAVLADVTQDDVDAAQDAVDALKALDEGNGLVVEATTAIKTAQKKLDADAAAEKLAAAEAKVADAIKTLVDDEGAVLADVTQDDVDAAQDAVDELKALDAGNGLVAEATTAIKTAQKKLDADAAAAEKLAAAEAKVADAIKTLVDDEGAVLADVTQDDVDAAQDAVDELKALDAGNALVAEATTAIKTAQKKLDDDAAAAEKLAAAEAKVADAIKTLVDDEGAVLADVTQDDVDAAQDAVDELKALDEGNGLVAEAMTAIKTAQKKLDDDAAAAEKLAAAEQKVKDAIATLVDDKGAVLADVTQKKVDDAQAALGELKALDEDNALVVEATTAIKTAQDKLDADAAAEKLAAAEQKVKDAIATLVDDKGAVLADVTQKKVDDAQAALGELKALDEDNGLVVEATTAIKTAQDKLDADAAAEKLAAAEQKVKDAIATLVDDKGAVLADVTQKKVDDAQAALGELKALDEGNALVAEATTAIKTAQDKLDADAAAEKLAAAEQKVKDAIATLVDDKGAVLADVTQKKVDDAQAALGELKALDEGNALVVEATTAIKTAQDKLDADAAAAEKLAAAEKKVADAIKTLVDDKGAALSGVTQKKVDDAQAALGELKALDAGNALVAEATTAIKTAQDKLDADAAAAAEAAATTAAKNAVGALFSSSAKTILKSGVNAATIDAAEKLVGKVAAANPEKAALVKDLAAARALLTKQVAAQAALDALVDSKGALKPGVTKAKMNAAIAAVKNLDAKHPLVKPLNAAIAKAKALLDGQVNTDNTCSVENLSDQKFADTALGHKFYTEINWMSCKKLSTGNKNPAGGKPNYAPKDNLSREAMAAFIYRYVAPKGYTAPAVSPFADVAPGDKFYKEIAWMYQMKLSTGNKNPAGGKPNYAPKENLSREAMAAFIYRLETSKSSEKYAAPSKSLFADMVPESKFYKEISWMKQKGLTTGNKNLAGGLPNYAPKDNLSREAMAAFMYRLGAGK